MKRRALFAAFAALALLAGFIVGTRGGPEPAKALGQSKPYFQIFSSIDFTEQHRWILNTSPGVPADGWVYGNRLAYKCVYWFLYRGGAPVAKVQYQRVTGAPYLKIADKYGVQEPITPGEDCGATAPYVQNPKPPGLPSTTVAFSAGGVQLQSLLFPSTSPINPNVWFELDESTPGLVSLEQYNVSTTVALITITRLDPTIELVVTQA